jgi:hypothetical protein
VPKQDLSGSDVVLGFDYDHSIKHQLPPGFKYAMKIATSMLDPGLYSDPYSDNPYLYGPALSGLFTLNIGDLTSDVSASEQLTQLERATSGVVEEGGTGTGASIRKSQNLPSKWKKRRKHFLDAAALSKFTFEKGRMYHADFFNPHLDFANFSLRLPGFSISIGRYIDEKTHHLRYVLKNRATDEVLFVVFFKLLFGEELERVRGEKKDEAVGDGKMDDGGRGKSAEETHATGRTASIPAAGERTDSANVNSKSFQKPKTVEPEKPSAQAPPPAVDGANDESGNSYSPTAAITTLSNSIYAAITAMGLWDDNTSSSDSEEPSRASSPKPSDKALAAGVEDMDDATVERFLQSRQGNAG